MFDIKKFIDEISKFSEDGDGVTRLPFTNESVNAFLYIEDTMKRIGLSVCKDKYGTIQGHLNGKSDETIIIASHYDSVVHGGKYDGIVGIAVGLAVASHFISNNIVPNYSIDILALNDEEGVKFNFGFLSSKALTDKLEIGKIYDKFDKTSLSEYLYKNMYGCDDINLKTTLKSAVGYIETHIEQGLILEENNCDLGLVQNIVGIGRYYITVYGNSGHAGTTLMNQRNDALVKACKIITSLQEIPKNYNDSVLTVGYMDVFPNAINVISDKVVFSIDYRSPNLDDMEKISKDIENTILKYDEKIIIEETINIEPISLKNQLSDKLEKEVSKSDFNYMKINSGAGHDAQIFSEFMDTAMLFVPSKLGYSHRPDEYTDLCYIEKACHVLIELLN